MTEEIRCIGCGAVIQTEDPDKIGYAPKSSLNNEQVICKRCFRLKHYNEIQDVALTDDDFLRILNQISSKQALIVYVVDILISMVVGYLDFLVLQEVIRYYLSGTKKMYYQNH